MQIPEVFYFDFEEDTVSSDNLYISLGKSITFIGSFEKNIFALFLLLNIKIDFFKSNKRDINLIYKILKKSKLFEQIKYFDKILNKNNKLLSNEIQNYLNKGRISRNFIIHELYFQFGNNLKNNQSNSIVLTELEDNIKNIIYADYIICIILNQQNNEYLNISVNFENYQDRILNWIFHSNID